MRVAFIPTAYRTIFFHAVAARLEEAGHQVFWLSPNRRWARWLIGRGVGQERIFDLTRHAGEWSSPGPPAAADLETLRVLEAAGELTARNIILMDPLLRRRPRERALRYLAACARQVRRFLEESGIGLVLGERTWAFELLTGEVCRALGIPHLVPHTARIPDPRFAFFDDYHENGVVELRQPAESDRAAAARELERFRERRPQPGYMAIDRAVLRPEWQRLALLARHLIDLAGDPHDETSLRPVGLLRHHATRVFLGWRNRRFAPFERPPLPPRRPFVFFPLHMQPEASIDVMGSPWTGQIELLRAMARTLPVTHELWVKEHGIALEWRARSFYRQLLAIPGVRLIHPAASSFELLQHADLVITVTGTAAYEAALLGRPAATIAPIFFDRVVAFPRFDPFNGSLAELLGRAGSATAGDERLIDFLAWLLVNTFPGVVGDALWQPWSMEGDNVDQVARGVLAVLAAVSDSSSRQATLPSA